MFQREDVDHDGLGNQLMLSSETERWFDGVLVFYSASTKGYGYEPGVGWLKSFAGDTIYHDGAGNELFRTAKPSSSFPRSLRDVASFYSGDGKLAATDARSLASDDPMVVAFFTRVFEEYGYDALGRRILVRSRRSCDTDPGNWEAYPHPNPFGLEVATRGCREGANVVRSPLPVNEKPLATCVHNIYVCNMSVANARRSVEGESALAAVLAAISDLGGSRAIFVAGAAGFGKSSVLAAVFNQLRARREIAASWISGGIVGSGSHFAALLSDSLGRPELAALSLAAVLDSWGGARRRMILAIDDIDALVFKREAVASAIGAALARNPSATLLATCRLSARERFLSSSHPFSAASEVPATAITLLPMDADNALSLILRRAPSLSLKDAHEVMRAAGGHPAALVFLARMAEMRKRKGGDLCHVFERATEFAGAVYAESWASLGPQQRAVLWELSSRPSATAADVAVAIRLPASHVSAQMSRLVADGLVRREVQRGRYSVAPLLAGWIARRAARNEGNDIVANKRISLLESKPSRASVGRGRNDGRGAVPGARR